MGYYMSGGYYRAGGYYRGGFFSSVGKAIGKAAGVAQKLAPVATMVNPGLGMAMGSIGGIGSQLFGKVPTVNAGAITIPGGQPVPTVPSLDFLKGFPQLTGPGGGTFGKGALVETPAGTVLVKGKSRRMNPLNPRALSRAYRRLNSASKWAHRLFNVSKPRHGVKPKFGRRRSR